MRRALAVVLTAGALLLMTPAPASADDRRPCVTEGEFYGFEFTWTKAEVHAYFETNGRRDGLNTDSRRIARSYKLCDAHRDAQLIVIFSRSTQHPRAALMFTPDERKTR
jgi:hypothetical protein